MSDAIKPMVKVDEDYARSIVEVLNTKALVIIPAVDRYSGSSAMLLGVAHEGKVCPVGRILNVEEIEYGLEILISPEQLVSGKKVPGLELWYENRFIKPSGKSTETPNGDEQAGNERIKET